MNKTLELSVTTGGVVTIGFFLLTFASLFMVGGDGTAPWITHLMLKLGEVPTTMFGLPKSSLLIVSPLFWGAIAFISALLVLSTVSAIQPHPKMRSVASTLLRTLLVLAILAMVFLV
jgi:hypothetical protein